jgi:hypothetical protein
VPFNTNCLITKRNEKIASHTTIPIPPPPPSSAGATVRDEPWPLLRLFAIGPDPETFVSIRCFRPAALVKSLSTIKAFYAVGLLNPTLNPNLEDQGIPFCLDHHI